MRPNELWTRPDVDDAQTQPSGHKPLVVNVEVVGPVELEEEGIGISNDVVKVQGEDPETQKYLSGNRLRRVVGDFELWVRPPWLAREEPWGPEQFPNISFIKQSNTLTRSMCLSPSHSPALFVSRLLSLSLALFHFLSNIYTYAYTQYIYICIYIYISETM